MCLNVIYFCDACCNGNPMCRTHNTDNATKANQFPTLFNQSAAGAEGISIIRGKKVGES